MPGIIQAQYSPTTSKSPLIPASSSMSDEPNKKQTGQILYPEPQAWLHDPRLLPYDIYRANGGFKGSLGKFNKAEDIAVIGGGITGLAIASFCKNAGSDQVDIYEAKDRVGGRLESVRFGEGWYQNGAMRIGPTSAITLSTMKEFECGMKPRFPDPGIVMTGCDYRGHIHDWLPGKDTPEVYRHVDRAFQAYCNEDVKRYGQVVYASPFRIRRMLLSPKLEDRMEAVGWVQKFLDSFGGHDFYSVLKTVFSQEDGWESPGGLTLTGSDLRKLADAGVGTGPFDPIFQMSAIQVYNFLVNGHEDQQGSFVTVEGGKVKDAPIQVFADRMEEYVREQGVNIRLKSLVKFVRRIDPRSKTVLVDASSRVNGQVEPLNGYTNGKANGQVNVNGHHTFETAPPKYEITWIDEQGQMTSKTYDTVFFCTPVRTMLHHIRGLPALLGRKTIQDLETVSPIPSTKIFGTINNVLLEYPDFYQCMTTDQDFKQLYLMPSGDPNKLVVLLSYTWGDDALNLDRYGHDEILCKEILRQVRQVVSRSTWPKAAKYFEDDQVTGLQVKRWHPEHDIEGAFGLERPGDGYSRHRLLHHPLGVKDGLYICGADLSHDSGWIEPAFISAYMAVISKLRRDGTVKEEVDEAACFDEKLIKFPLVGKESVVGWQNDSRAPSRAPSP